MEQATKRCTTCGVEKPLDDFPRQGNRKRHARCKECGRAVFRAWRAANPERSAVSSRKWRERNSERARQYQQKRDREARAAYSREYRRKNRGAVNAYNQAWCEANKDLYVLRSHLRRAAVRQLEPGDRADMRAYVKVLRADPCSYCGEPGGTVDHITPVAANGDLGWKNLTASCRSCNASKSTTPLLVFLHRRMTDPNRQGGGRDGR